MVSICTIHRVNHGGNTALKDPKFSGLPLKPVPLIALQHGLHEARTHGLLALFCV
jgi:hypothetical protein